MINTENYQNTLAYDLLNEIIEKEISNLKSYVNRPDSKESVISIKNAHIMELMEVLKSIRQLRFYKIWLQFEETFNGVINQDPTINSFIFVAKPHNTKENPFYFSYCLSENYD